MLGEGKDIQIFPMSFQLEFTCFEPGGVEKVMKNTKIWTSVWHEIMSEALYLKVEVLF